VTLLSGRVPGFRGKQIATAVGVAAVLTLGFYATDLHMAALASRGREFWSPSLPLDDSIPFHPGWIWVYLLYFPACFAPLFLRRVRDDAETFQRTALGFTIQFLVSILVFWAAPSRMLRPPVVEAGLSWTALSWMYQIDDGFNIFPSLHVANTAYIACVMGRFGGAASGAGMWALCLFITVSTLFVKQHYLLDLPTGLLLGTACFRIAFSSALNLRRWSEVLPWLQSRLASPGRFWTVAIHGAAGAFGLGTVFWLGRHIGWGAIGAAIGSIGWTAAVGLTLLYAVPQFLFCCGWYWTLGPWRKKLGLRGIVIPFLAGDAVNCSIPSANAAGEPVKVLLLRHRVPVEDCVASVTLYKASDFVSLLLFLSLGLAVARSGLSFPRPWLWGASVVLFGMAGVTALFLLARRTGFYGPLLKGGSGLMGLSLSAGLRAGAESADRSVREFAAREPGAAALSLLCNVLGWFGGVVEAYICLRLLDLPAGWRLALAIETFALFFNNVTFFIPARLGVLEGSRVLIFGVLGLPPAAGMAYGLIRRARELAWMALGYGLLAVYWPKSNGLAPSPLAGEGRGGGVRGPSSG